MWEVAYDQTNYLLLKCMYTASPSVANLGPAIKSSPTASYFHGNLSSAHAQCVPLVEILGVRHTVPLLWLSRVMFHLLGTSFGMHDILL